MKCSALVQGSRPETIAAFLEQVLHAERCDREAVWIGPLGEPLCEACAQERKSAHEAGATLAALLQQAQFGKVKPYMLRRMQ